ncbi:MAG: hypothetical protein IKJ74_02005 [Clostridia bacterium]|nr:hypothetical protein [Clostridia bacterium]
MIRKRKIGFSVLDVVILTLVAACILSTVFQDQLRTFLGQSDGVAVEVTFLVENVTEASRNRPLAGEEVTLADTGASLGTVLSVMENKNLYESVSDPSDTMEVLTLTCKIQTTAVKTETGYEVQGASVKPGGTLSVETPTASFVMLVTMVKEIEITE